MNISTRMMRTCAATAVALAMATAGILAQSAPLPSTPTQKIGTMRIEMLSEVASPIYGFSLSIENPSDTSTGGGSGAGKASFSEIEVLRVPDAMSPAIVLAAVTGRHLTRVQIDLKSGDSSYLLTDVLISGYSTTGGLEKVSFTYARIQFTAGGATTCFDLKTYSAC